MGNQFVKGWTNNHLTWVMVDATDFATPESALSAATKIKIYGKRKGQAGANFVSSGTGSLTNDIQHVGASALGIYTIALAKADLSDASAAWYDQYIISLSATGAAYQTLVVDGGVWISDLSAVASDIRSNVSDLQSDFQSRVPKAVATNSQLSDLHSDLRSFLVVMSGIQSDLYSAVSDLQSDFQSRVPKRVATDSQLSDMASDIKSAVAAVTATISASDMSDIVSRVWSTKYIGVNAHNVASSFGSAFRVMASNVSDVYSLLSDHHSDFQSRVPKAVATNSQLSDLHSDLRSFLVIMSGVQSDVYSALSDMQSDFQSRVPKRVATDSQLSDMASDIKSAIAGITATISASDMSDIASRVWSTKYIGATAHNVGSSFGSAFRVMTSTLSDAYSAVLLAQSLASDAHSAAVVAQNLSASDLSDIRSAIAAGPAATVTASDISDIASAVWAMKYIGAGAHNVASSFGSAFRVMKSDVSDIDSMLTVMSGILSDTYSALLLVASDTSDLASRITTSPATASDVASKVWGEKYTVAGNKNASTFGSLFDKMASGVSDTRSMVTVMSDVLSDFYSDFQSRVPKAVATNSQLSDLASDLKSAVAAGPAATVTTSDISDIASAVWAFATRKLTSNISLNASDMSDIRSAITAGGGTATISVSDISDIASAVRAILVSDLSDILSAAQQTNSRALVIQSLVSDVDSALTSRFSNLESLVGTTGVQVNASSLSDIRSAITAAAITASQVKVQVVNALSVDTYAEPGQGAPAATASISTKLGHLYKLSRNKITQDATTLKIFSDDTVTVDAKATVSDDGTTYTRSELVTGP